MDTGFLKDLVVILTGALVVVVILHRFRIPAIAGFILAGMIIGPRSLGLVSDVQQVRNLAEIGVVLLLFGIGLELSLERMKRLWRPVIVGGLLQVLFFITVAYIIGRQAGLSGSTALFIGFIMSTSSTAVVIRGLETRGEIDAPHGRLSLGIQVLQDLCLVPMMMAFPYLAGKPGNPLDILYSLTISGVLVGAVLVASRKIIPRILGIVARTRQRSLFVMAVLLICIGTAWATSEAGVTLALGAFLAGLVVAGSGYKFQALSDLLAFKDVFAGVFFVSVGMLLVPGVLTGNIVPILALLAVIMIGKFILVLLTGIIIRLPLRVAVLTGVALAQIGEFAFVLFAVERGTGLIEEPLAGNLMAAAILSMLITPFAMALGPHLAAGASKIKALTRLMKVHEAEEADASIKSLHNHIIIGGFGFTGHELASALKDCQIPYLIVDLNVENVRRAQEKKEPIYFGDITSAEVLDHLGATRARALIIAINDPGAVLRTVKSARSLSPDLYILARTNYILDVGSLLEAGASEVIPSELEAAARVTARTLIYLGVDKSRVAQWSAELYPRSEKDKREVDGDIAEKSG